MYRKYCWTNNIESLLFSSLSCHMSRRKIQMSTDSGALEISQRHKRTVGLLKIENNTNNTRFIRLHSQIFLCDWNQTAKFFLLNFHSERNVKLLKTHVHACIWILYAKVDEINYQLKWGSASFNSDMAYDVRWNNLIKLNQLNLIYSNWTAFAHFVSISVVGNHRTHVRDAICEESILSIYRMHNNTYNS